MDALMSTILRKAQIHGSPYYEHDSCHRFMIPEELRAHDISTLDTEKTPVHRPGQQCPISGTYPSRHQEMTAASLSRQPHHHLYLHTAPVARQYHHSVTVLSNSDFDQSNIKRETPSPTHMNTDKHPFSVEALVGDVIDKNISSECTKPAEIFISVLLNDQRDKYAMYRALIANLCSQNSIHNHQQTSPVYWCHVCNATCVNKDDVQRHKVAHITKGDRCRLKTALYKEHGCVTVHEKIDDERIKCGLCDKVVSQCFFSKHQRLHEGRFCKECGKEFSTNSRLQDHKNSHSGVTPFTCTICDRQFAKRSSWTQHQRYHRDHRSFQCQYCKKRFNSKYACAVHERLHTGDNPFKCEYPGCKRSYPQKIQLKLHMNTHR